MGAAEHAKPGSPDNSDTEDPKQHSKLLSAISRLDYKQRVKPPSRKEPSLHVSEFHLAKAKTSKHTNPVSLNALAGVLVKGATSHAVISRKVQAVQKKAKTLAKPLEKIVADRAKRSTGFEKTKEVLSRWDPVVASNRVADQLSFPLCNETTVKVNETNIFATQLKPRTDLEKEMYEVLKSNGYIKSDEKKKEDQSSFPLTLEEVLAQRRETARLKAQSSQQQVKAWRRNKIKSKKFHRVLRKEKIRKQIKEFETLKDTDPEEALKRLDQLERTRAHERASLRHRNTGPWARNKAIHAKYDRECRQELAQQLSISRDLTQKVQAVNDSSDSADDGDEPAPDLVFAPPIQSETSNNIWSEEIGQFVSGYRKYWEQRNMKVNPIMTPAGKVIVTPVDETAGDLVTSTAKDEKIDKNKSLNKYNSSQIIIDIIKTDKDNTGIAKLAKKRCSSGSWVITDTESTSNTIPCKSSNKQKKKLSRSQKNANLLPDTSNVEIIDLFNEVENNQELLLTKSLARLKKSANLTVKSDDFISVNGGTNKKKSTNNGEKGRRSKNSEKQNQTGYDFETDIGTVKELRSSSGKKKTINISLSEQTKGATVSHSPLVHAQTLIDMMAGGDSKKNDSKVACAVSKSSEADNIDPSKFLSARPLRSRAAELVSAGLEDLDDMEEEEAAKHRVTIAEAFADDDVVDDFRKEKDDLENASKPTEIDLSLPGWGEWGGKNLAPTRRKRQRFILKPTQEAPRRDRNKHNVIIYEGKDSGMMNHQVSDLPFPFESVKEFEASVRAPVGSTWVPETAHHKLIAPHIITRQGQVIKPMTEEVLLNASMN